MFYDAGHITNGLMLWQYRQISLSAAILMIAIGCIGFLMLSRWMLADLRRTVPAQSLGTVKGGLHGSR